MYKINLTIVVISITFLILATILDAFKEVLEKHFEKSKVSKWNKNFWKPELAINKRYRNGKKEDGERFLYSSTVFSFLTNGYDLTIFVRNTFIFSSLSAFIIPHGFYLIFLYIIIAHLVVRKSFQSFYDYMLKTNKDETGAKNHRI